MLKGRSVTQLDKQGRLRIPLKFRRTIEKKYGKEVFITSMDDEHIKIYPILEWMNMTYVTNEIALKNRTIRKFILRVNMLGVKTEIDRWGRILIHKELRDKINFKGKIIVEGAENHLLLKQNAF